jgi:uncharacterized protein YbjT (DUF2867 family)
MTTTLLVGASGTVGSELARLLAAAGHTVRRATSRTPTAPDQVKLDLLTGEGRSAAFDGVDRAFLLSPPGHTNQLELLGPLVDEAQARKLDKVVLMTAMGANADPSTPFRQLELKLGASGVPFNVIRPNWFMQNFNTYWVQGIQQQGAIFLPTGQAKGSFIDARDIAAAAAVLLQGHSHDGQEFDLTGGEALNHAQVAQVLSAASGRAIRYEDISPEAMLQGLLGAGLPRPLVGRAPITLAQYAHDHRQAWA